MWSITPYRQQLICTLKEHKAPVSAVDINKAGTEAVSAGTDGTCIIWDLVRQCRRQILFGTTLFMCARYYPTDVQILTGGSDRKLSYWEVLDGTLVREVEGSTSGAINALDISEEGSVFVTGGNDQIVKLWNYQLGNFCEDVFQFSRSFWCFRCYHSHWYWTCGCHHCGTIQSRSETHRDD